MAAISAIAELTGQFRYGLHFQRRMWMIGSGATKYSDFCVVYCEIADKILHCFYPGNDI